jgi:hypothetical protein
MLKLMPLALVIGYLAIPTLVAAQGAPSERAEQLGQGGEEHHHGPGPESIAACKAKSEGDACEYDGPRGHEAGTCHKARSGDLACFHPHQHHEHEQDGGAR